MSFNYSRKIIYNLTDNTADYIKAGGEFLFLGQSDSKLFFENIAENQYINETLFKNKGLIFSVSQNGIKLENMLSDTTFLFYNNAVDLYFDLGDINYITSNYPNFEPVKIRNPIMIPYFKKGEIYLLLDKKHLLRINGERIEIIDEIKLSNLGIEKIDDFVIRDNFIILSYYRNYPEMTYEERKRYITENGLTGEIAGLSTNYKGFLIYNMTNDNIKYPKICVSE